MASTMPRRILAKLAPSLHHSSSRRAARRRIIVWNSKHHSESPGKALGTVAEEIPQAIRPRSEQARKRRRRTAVHKASKFKVSHTPSVDPSGAQPKNNSHFYVSWIFRAYYQLWSCPASRRRRIIVFIIENSRKQKEVEGFLGVMYIRVILFNLHRSPKKKS